MSTLKTMLNMLPWNGLLTHKNNMKNLPNKTGIWEWFDLDGNRRLVFVWNIFDKYPKNEPYFRVCWRGSYYDVSPEPEDNEMTRLLGKTSQERFDESGWSRGTWGNYLGQYEDFNETELYI